jgi:hypothetical protein
VAGAGGEELVRLGLKPRRTATARDRSRQEFQTNATEPLRLSEGGLFYLRKRSEFQSCEFFFFIGFLED